MLICKFTLQDFKLSQLGFDSHLISSLNSTSSTIEINLVRISSVFALLSLGALSTLRLAVMTYLFIAL